MDTDELIKNVVLWGRKKHLDDPLMQYIKTVEEVAEIAHEITRGSLISPELKDAIGDSTVTLIILADILGFDFKECLEMAWNEIKDRKGKTINHSFIKE